MSFGGKGYQPAERPKTAGVDSDNYSSNQEAVPLRWFAGVDYCPLTWISDIHNPVYEELRTKAGKGESVTTGHKVFGDIAGLACVGLVDAVEAIECDAEEVWVGNVSRPADPMSPHYWRTEIVTSVGTFYVYWGREDQPVDDVLLGPLGAAKPELAHPAYRGQCYVVCKRYFFGQNRESVPSTRIRLRRAPRPDVGAFAPQNAAGGESLVAATLELLTNRRFGAAMPADHFTAAQWESLSAAVLAATGGHSPTLDRQREVRDFIREAFVYFDGWARIEGGKIVPGRFPHDGSLPAGMTELSHHDMTARPQLGAPGYAATANEVEVIFRDRTRKLKEDGILETAEANARARRRHQVTSLSMPWIIDRTQAAAFAAEAAQSAAEGERTISFPVRRARAVWAGGADLQAGDNFNLDYQPFALDEVARITRRRDDYGGEVTLEAVAERGLYPLPYTAPNDARTTLGQPRPQEIAAHRILELTTALAGTPAGIYVAILAKRPRAAYPAPNADVFAGSVTGFSSWYSADGGSYDLLGRQTTWAVSATLRAGYAAGAASPLTVQLALDADNLDAGRISPLSDEDRNNDTLLLIVGDEVMSVGGITISGLNWDLACLRARQGSLAAAASTGAPAWLVYRDELVALTHARFVESQTRWFKLQPYTSGEVLDLADADAISYAFRDRAPERPVVTFSALPSAPIAGLTYFIAGQISDVNGDLSTYRIEAARVVAGVVDSRFVLQAGEFPPAERALSPFKVPVVFPAAGTWRIVVRAFDERAAYTETASGDLTVGAGAAPGVDDGVTPDVVSGVSIQPGLGLLWLTWTNPTNTAPRTIFLYESATTVRPANPVFALGGTQTFLAREGLPANTTRHYWLEVESYAGRRSAIAGPFSGTTRAGINVADFVPGLAPVEIVGALPAAGNFQGRVVFLTTDLKLYRWTSAAVSSGTAHWSAAVSAVDIAGQLADAQVASLSAAKLTGLLSDSQIAGLAAAKLTGQIVATQITDGAITTPKISAGAVTANEVAANAITAAKIAASAIIAEKLAAGAVTTDKLAANAVTANELAANAVTAAKIAANAVVAGAIAAGAITADKVGANQIITSAANIADAIITGAKIANATIGTAQIGDLAVTTLKIANQAVTVPVAASRASGPAPAAGVWEDILSFPVTNSGSPAILQAGFQSNSSFNPNRIRILRNGSVITDQVFAAIAYDNPGAGTHTYTLQGLGTGFGATFANSTLLYLEVKK